MAEKNTRSLPRGKETASDWASTAAGEAKNAVGSGMESLGEAIRDRGPQQGVMGSAADKVAANLESAGQYLQGHDFREMGKDCMALIRRYPLQAVLVGLGVGFLMARATRS